MFEINKEEIKNMCQRLIRSLCDELEVNPPRIDELQNSLAKLLGKSYGKAGVSLSDKHNRALFIENTPWLATGI